MTLRSITPRVATLAPLVAKPARGSADASRERDAALAYRAWYKTARWGRHRLAILWRDQVTCAKCGVSDTRCRDLIRAAELIGLGLDARDLRQEFSRLLVASQVTWIADHIEPHRGDEALFWDIQNGQCLCKPCHDRDKQREEARARRQW